MKSLILAFALFALAPLGGSAATVAPKPASTKVTAVKGEYVAAYRPYRYRYYRYYRYRYYRYRYYYYYHYRYWSDARPVAAETTLTVTA